MPGRQLESTQFWERHDFATATILGSLDLEKDTAWRQSGHDFGKKTILGRARLQSCHLSAKRTRFAPEASVGA